MMLQFFILVVVNKSHEKTKINKVLSLSLSTS